MKFPNLKEKIFKNQKLFRSDKNNGNVSKNISQSKFHFSLTNIYIYLNVCCFKQFDSYLQ